MGNRFSEFAGEPAVSVPANRFASFASEVKPRKTFAIDWLKPSNDVRAEIAKLPEEDREDAIRQWAEAKVEKNRSGPATPSNNPVAEGIRHFGRGTIVGSFLDEADAKVNDALFRVSGGAMGVPEEEALAYNRARSAAEDKASPVLGTALKLAGGLTSGAPILKAAMGKAKSRAGKYLTGVGAAGTAGAVYGFGEGEGGLENRLESAESGGKLGLALGAALPPAFALAAKAAQKGADVLPAIKARLPISKVSNPDEVADAWLASKLRRSGQTPQSVADDLATGEEASRLGSNSRLGKPGVNQDNLLLPETVADTSDALQRLAGSVYRAGGEGADIVKKTLEGRQRGPANPYAPRENIQPQGQLERMIDAFDRAMRIRTKGSARYNEKAILASQKAKGASLYDKARNASDDFDLQPAIDAHTHVMMQWTGPERATLQKALDLFVKPMNREWKVNDVRRFDIAKQQLDDMIEGSMSASDPLRGPKATNLTRALVDFKNALLARVHEPLPNGKPRNPAYAEARAAWGSEAENLRALDMGRKALNENSEISVEQFAELSDSQKILFRIGLRESLRNALGRTRPGHDATKFFDQRRVQELIAAAIPRSKSKGAVFADRPQRFGEIVRREQRMGETLAEALRNSKTAQRHQDDAEFASDAVASILTSGRSMVNYALEAIGVGLQRIFGYRQDVALALARRLMETDPARRAAILNAIAAHMGPSRFASLSKLLGEVAAIGTTPAAISGSQSEAPARGP